MAENTKNTTDNAKMPETWDELKEQPLFAGLPDMAKPQELNVAQSAEFSVTWQRISERNGKLGDMGLFGDDEADKPKKKPKPAKPRTASLFKSMDLATVTLEQALQLMSLPRVLGTDAEGVEITVQNGRFGPYLKKGTDSRSIGSEDEIFTITLEQALEIYSQPKQRGRAAAKPPLAELGVDPVSEKKIVVKDGRFGPYITDGITNITVPRAESVESLTHERAVQLLADKRAKGPVKRKTAAKKTTTAKKTTAKKTTAKSTTAKKTTTRKTAAKKTAE